MWTAADKAITYEQVKSDAKQAKKDITLVREFGGFKKYAEC